MGHKILIVEDSPTQAMILSVLLEKEGYRVRIARDGQEGLQAAREDKPDLILSDIQMPSMNGYEMCRAIKSEPSLKHIPVVLLTSLSDAADVLRALEVTADYYLTKPYYEAHLLSKVQAILEMPPSREGMEPDEGLEANFRGQRHLIQANRTQMLTLLLSTYENAVEKNRDLLETQRQLEQVNEELEKTVKELRKSKITAEAANRSKDHFLASMSHELRTPLNAIIGFSEILEDMHFGPLNQKQIRYVTNILNSSRHLLQLINDILDLSKVESGKMEFQPSRVNVGALLKNSLVMVKEKAMNHQIELKLEISNLPRDFQIQADERKLKQIMFNLLSNATKFTPDGGCIIISARIPSPSVIEISVMDTGIGIEPENRNRIFDEFVQLDSSHNRQYAGTGLGLALTRRLVEIHGGQIKLESAGEGKGSTFTFSIPTNIASIVDNRPSGLNPGAIV